MGPESSTATMTETKRGPRGCEHWKHLLPVPLDKLHSLNSEEADVMVIGGVV